jgi:hypothetical protein
VDPARAVGLRAGALAAADRLVVGVAVVPEREVVHRPLAGRGHGHELAEGSEDDVDDPRGGLGVPGDDGGGRARVDEAALRRGDGDRRERASRCGQVRLGQAADDEVAGGLRDRERAVEVAVVLLRSPAEVDPDFVAGDLGGAVDRQVAVHRLDHVLGLAATVRKRGERGAHHALGVGVELVHRGGDSIPAAARAQLLEPSLGEAVRGELRSEVTAPLLRLPRRQDEPLEHLVRQELRREDHAFFLEHVRERGQARRLDPADVRVVGARDRVAEPGARNERYVGQVGAAGVRVVEDRDLPLVEAEPHHGRDRVGHRTEVDGDVLGLRDHATALVEKRSRAVAALLDVGRERGADQDRAHLLGNRPQGGADHLQLNWWDHVTHASAPSCHHP